MTEFDSRIYSFYKEIKDINKGIFNYPRFMALYPTNACQFNCTFCDYKELNHTKVRELSETEWKYILDTFKNLDGEAIGLSGGGEPLMLSTIEKLLEYTNKLDLKVGLVTNGLNIDKQNRRELYELLHNCSYVRISFEAGSEQEFNRIKGKSYFNHILRNVSEFINDKPDKLQVSYKYTIPISYSYNDIEHAIKLADFLGFYSIQFKGVSNSTLELDIESKILLKEFINSIKTYNVKVICDFDIYAKINKECRISTIQTLIDNYGDIYICCYYRHRPEEMKIGNIFEKKFTDIWGSFDHYNKIMNVDCNKCNLYDCRYIRYDELMKEAINTNYLSFI
jgi:radical SAM protein with 4Fe4S-binding SPASM domain